MKHKSILAWLAAMLLLMLCSLPGRAQILTPMWAEEPEAEQLIEHDGFVVSYNEVTKCPNWVSWDLSPEEASADVTGRTDFFTTDPLIKGPQAEYADYGRNDYGLDRGHMAPSADFKWSKDANAQTFYLTNICPQDHTLNEGLWLELEQRCRAWAKRYNTTLQIVCGPVHGKNPVKIGKNGVWVPTAFFKVIRMTVEGKPYCIAFIFPNAPLDINDDIFDYVVTSGYISHLTGLNVSCLKNAAETNKAFPWDIPWKKPKKS